MRFYMALLVWLLIAVVLGWAILTAAHGGSAWFLVVVVLGLVVLVARTGCKVH